MNKNTSNLGGNNSVPTIEQLTQTFVDCLGGIDKDIANGVVGFGGEANEATEVEPNEGHVSHVFNQGEGMNDKAHSTPEQSTVAYGPGYNNAFWNGESMTYPRIETGVVDNAYSEPEGDAIQFEQHPRREHAIMTHDQMPSSPASLGILLHLARHGMFRDAEGLADVVPLPALKNGVDLGHGYSPDYNNAFWNQKPGERTEGPGKSFGEQLAELAGGKVINFTCHELPHGVTGEGFADLVSDEQVEDALRRIRENEGLDQVGENS